METLQYEDFEIHAVHKNEDLVRRIRETLNDGGVASDTGKNIFSLSVLNMHTKSNLKYKLLHYVSAVESFLSSSSAAAANLVFFSSTWRFQNAIPYKL